MRFLFGVGVCMVFLFQKKTNINHTLFAFLKKTLISQNDNDQKNEKYHAQRFEKEKDGKYV